MSGETFKCLMDKAIKNPNDPLHDLRPKPDRLAANFSGPVLPPFTPEIAGSVAEPKSQFSRNGDSLKKLRQMRSAECQDSIDLHGMKAKDAHAALDQFLQDAIGQGLTTVEVVHGRGTGVLREKARQWLEGASWVLGYLEPHDNKGSVRVLLRRCK